jgi:hypothetical protein
MTIYNVAGFHTYNSALSELFNKKQEDEMEMSLKARNSIFLSAKILNTFNLLGALPLGGILTGYRRIQNLQAINPLSIKIYTYVRAIFEILGCGFLFVITIDLSVSLHRHFLTKGTVYPPRESDVTYFDVFKGLIKNKFDEIKEDSIEESDEDSIEEIDNENSLEEIDNENSLKEIEENQEISD